MARSNPAAVHDDLRFLAGDGEMARRFREQDWTATPLGPPEAWPQPLKIAVRIALATHLPICIFWGPERLGLCNDAFARALGADRHPAHPGQPGPAAWAEIWPQIGPDIGRLMAGGGAADGAQPLSIMRRGAAPVSWACSLTPIDDGVTGRIGGVMMLATETIERGGAGHQTGLEARRLRELFDRAPGLMCVLGGPDHVYEVTNRAYGELVGGRELIGKAVRDALPEVVGQGFIDLLDKVYRSGQPHVATATPVELNRHPGQPLETRLVDFVYQPILGDDGSVTGIFCQGSDVTEAQAVRNSLAESETRFRTMADHAPVMLWVTAPDGNCLWLNARWYEYTGQTQAEALGLGWTNAIHPEDRQQAEDQFLAANAARTPYRVEYRLRGRDGGYRWSIDAAAPRFTRGGTFLGFVGSVIDIDDRRISEERLRVSEARFRAAVDAIRGTLWTNSPDGRMTGAQPGWAALTGQTIDQYRDFGWSSAVHPEDAQPTLDAWNAAVTAKSPFLFEHRLHRADGSWGNYIIRAIPIIENGAITEWVGVHSDITEQRAAEAALRALNATLEDRIAAELRTRAEIEDSLRQSQKMEAIGHLTSGLAHDFNNMLTVIIGGLQILGRTLDPANAKARRYLDASLEGAQRAAGLVDRLMAFSRQQPIAPAAIDSNAVIAGMATMLTDAIGAAVVLELDLDPALPAVRSDAGLLESAILNLAINARDAMPAGGRLRIATRATELDAVAAQRSNVISGHYARISIIDTGTGMSPATIEKAFNPFFTTKDIGKGTGLGLSQVHGFARQCGGSVAIASKLGEGTEIRILLPLASSA